MRKKRDQFDLLKMASYLAINDTAFHDVSLCMVMFVAMDLTNALVTQSPQLSLQQIEPLPPFRRWRAEQIPAFLCAFLILSILLNTHP